MTGDTRELDGQVALVTGASRGIGRAIAVELGRRGARVALAQRGGADDTLRMLSAVGAEGKSFAVDLSIPADAQEAVAAAAEAFGRLDILVANAGVIHREPALEVSLEDWQRVIDINLTSVFAACQAFARTAVAADRGGRIVLIASVLAFQGGINVASYAAAKGGVAQLARALANEWSALDIAVNAVAPGYIANEITAPLRSDPVRSMEIERRIPAGHWGEVDEVADAVAYLASPGARYIHGHTLVVDGGWLGR